MQLSHTRVSTVEELSVVSRSTQGKLQAKREWKLFIQYDEISLSRYTLSVLSTATLFSESYVQCPIKT